MLVSYPAVIHNGDDGLWLEFYDLKGCQTFADNMRELLEYAKEALYCYITEELEYSGSLPLSSPVKEVFASAPTETVRVVSVEVPSAADTPALPLAG